MSHPGCRFRRAGFSLLEVMVALVITSLIALSAAGLVGGIVSQGAGRRTDRAAWNERWAFQALLDEAFRGLEVGTDSLSSFHGTPAEVRFTSNTPSARGWTELRRLRLSATGDAILLFDEQGRRDTLLTGVSAGFAYLLEAGERSEWLGGWSSPAGAPLAVRLIVRPGHGPSDTMLFRIGRRG